VVGSKLKINRKVIQTRARETYAVSKAFDFADFEFTYSSLTRDTHSVADGTQVQPELSLDSWTTDAAYKLEASAFVVAVAIAELEVPLRCQPRESNCVIELCESLRAERRRHRLDLRNRLRAPEKSVGKPFF
jgi:hypothetical protein